MIIENGDSKFTEEEKRNLVVREYTSEEIEKNNQSIRIILKCFIDKSFYRRSKHLHLMHVED